MRPPPEIVEIGGHMCQHRRYFFDKSCSTVDAAVIALLLEKPRSAGVGVWALARLLTRHDRASLTRVIL